MVTKVQVTMTEEQARLLMYAMDLYSRILMGQFEEIKHLFSGFGEEGKLYQRDDRYWHTDMDNLLRLLKQVVYPELHQHASWGITGFSEQNKCPKNATIVYDIYKSLDHAISWYHNPKGGWTVNYDKPMHWYPEIPLPEVKVFEE